MKHYIFYLLCGFAYTWLFVLIFNLHFIGMCIVSVAGAFLINNAIPTGNESYPFVRLSIIYTLLIIVIHWLSAFNNGIYSFFTPNLLWSICFIVSIISGIVYSFGKNGNGTDSRTIQLIANITGVCIFIIVLIVFWWHGAVAYAITRIFFMFIEESIAGLILILLERRMNNYYRG